MTLLSIWIINFALYLLFQGTLCDELDDCVHCFLKDPCSQQPCSVSSDCSNFCVNHTFQQLEVEQFVPGMYFVYVVCVLCVVNKLGS